MAERKHPYPNVVVGYTDPATGLFVEGVESASEGSGGLTNIQLRAEAVIIQPQWVDNGYIRNSDGLLLSETQYNVLTDATRTRTWSYVIDTNNNTVASPGPWE
jgi:hypothetical protein